MTGPSGATSLYLAFQHSQTGREGSLFSEGGVRADKADKNRHLPDISV
jgi:hypothetical protein